MDSLNELSQTYEALVSVTGQAPPPPPLQQGVLKRTAVFIMESVCFELQEDEEDEDEDPATQYMIEQSLLESNKRKEAQKPSSGPQSADSSPVSAAIRHGDEKLLKDLLVRRREEFSRADSRGWTPLHEAAAQTNQKVLELTLEVHGRKDAGPRHAGLPGPRDPVLQAEGGRDGAAAVARHLQAARERSPPAASLSSADPSLSRSPPPAIARLHELPAVAGATEGLRHVPGARPVRPAGTEVMQEETTTIIII
ncbi:uncharacterized protein LOC119229603 [Pungitius pungitius]|uniref:uncharacterized protein LOC119229603 n=1 Tax=Pungitius pungitius TaxID=134920 RepID=UPI002E129721